MSKPTKPKRRVLTEHDERIVDTKELLERVPLDRSTIWRMVREGRFPKPIQLTRSRIGWRWSAVLTWLADLENNPVKARLYFGGHRAVSDDDSERQRSVITRDRGAR